MHKLLLLLVSIIASASARAIPSEGLFPIQASEATSVSDLNTTDPLSRSQDSSEDPISKLDQFEKSKNVFQSVTFDHDRNSSTDGDDSVIPGGSLMDGPSIESSKTDLGTEPHLLELQVPDPSQHIAPKKSFPKWSNIDANDIDVDEIDANENNKMLMKRGFWSTITGRPESQESLLSEELSDREDSKKTMETPYDQPWGKKAFPNGAPAPNGPVSELAVNQGPADAAAATPQGFNIKPAVDSVQAQPSQDGIANPPLTANPNYKPPAPKSSSESPQVITPPMPTGPMTSAQFGGPMGGQMRGPMAGTFMGQGIPPPMPYNRPPILPAYNSVPPPMPIPPPKPFYPIMPVHPIPPPPPCP